MFSETVNLLERFVFWYISIVGAHPGALADKYYKNSIDIRQNHSSYRITKLEADLRELAANNAPDELFKINLKEKLKYSKASYQRRLIKHFLTTIEDYTTWINNGASGKPKPNRIASFDINQITIEHIYPQNAKAPVTDLEPLKHDIGNITFWGPDDNQKASNDPFVSKKSRYADSKIQLNNQLLILPEWTKQYLTMRQDKLIKMGVQIFSI